MSGPKQLRINYAALRHLLRRRREEQRLSLRQVERQSGVGSSTLSRLDNGVEDMNLDTFLKLVNWLRVDFSAVVTMPATAATTAPRDAITKLILEDESLTPTAREAINSVLMAMYRALS